MATSTAKIQCFTCRKETRTFNCGGCTNDFCLNCLTKHVQKLGQELDQIENDHDEFREKLNEKKDNPTKHQLIQKIDQWEKDSIKIIEQTAKECRARLMNYTNRYVIEIENKLNNIARELKRIREENEFNEIDLKQFRENLNQLQEELNQPTNISIEQISTSFVSKIVVILPVDKDSIWKQNGILVAGGNGQGNQLNQLASPLGIFIDDDRTIYIVDSGNSRIFEWKSNAMYARIVAGGKGHGNETNQLNHPTDVIIDRETNSLIIADWGNRRVMRWFRQINVHGEIIIPNIDCCGLTMDRDGSLYVSDYKRNEVRRLKREEKGKGTVVAGGNGNGNRLNQLNSPAFIFIDKNYSLYVADQNNHRVMKWMKDAKEGIIVAGGNDEGNSLKQLSSPQGVIVDQSGQIYVIDNDNHRVMRWCEGVSEGMIIIGGNGRGQQSNQLNRPSGLSFDRLGNLYIADCNNNRIQKFDIEQNEVN